MSKEKLLVLDLDETLIYSCERPIDIVKHDFVVGPFLVHKRPYLDSFISEMNELFDLAVWSSGSELYVSEIVNGVFPENITLAFQWSYERCTETFDIESRGVFYKKRLNKIKSHPLEKILIVEDTPKNCIDNYGNAVYVNHFYGDPSDTELLLLSDYLKRFEKIDDVRKKEKRDWKHQSKK